MDLYIRWSVVLGAVLVLACSPLQGQTPAPVLPASGVSQTPESLVKDFYAFLADARNADGLLEFFLSPDAVMAYVKPDDIQLETIREVIKASEPTTEDTPGPALDSVAVTPLGKSLAAATVHCHVGRKKGVALLTLVRVKGKWKIATFTTERINAPGERTDQFDGTWRGVTSEENSKVTILDGDRAVKVRIQGGKSVAAPPPGKDQPTAPPVPVPPLPLGSARPEQGGFVLSGGCSRRGCYFGIGYRFADGSRLVVGLGGSGHPGGVWYSRPIRETEVTRYSLLVGAGIAGSYELYLGKGIAVALTGGVSGARGLLTQASLSWYFTEAICFSLSVDVHDGLAFGWQVEL